MSSSASNLDTLQATFVELAKNGAIVDAQYETNSKGGGFVTVSFDTRLLSREQAKSLIDEASRYLNSLNPSNAEDMMFGGHLPDGHVHQFYFWPRHPHSEQFVKAIEDVLKERCTHDPAFAMNFYLNRLDDRKVNIMTRNFGLDAETMQSAVRMLRNAASNIPHALNQAHKAVQQLHDCMAIINTWNSTITSQEREMDQRPIEALEGLIIAAGRRFAPAPAPSEPAAQR